MKCSIALVYEGFPKPVFLGITYDAQLKVLVKRQLLKEARDALQEAETLGDDVLVCSFTSTLDKLQKTLDLVVPPEVEDLCLQGV